MPYDLTQGSRVESLAFNRQLLRDVHEEIFRDIYDWAGKYRTYDISKGNSYFAEYIRRPYEGSAR